MKKIKTPNIAKNATAPIVTPMINGKFNDDLAATGVVVLVEAA